MQLGRRVFPLIAAFLATSAYAEEKGNIDGVIVTKSKDRKAEAGVLGDKPVLDTPFSMTVVDAEDLRKRGAKSVRQIFINDPSFYTPASSNTPRGPSARRSPSSRRSRA